MNYLKQSPQKLAIILFFVMRRPHSINYFPLRHVPLRHEIFRDGVESSNSVTKYFVTEWNISTPSPDTPGSMNVFDQLLTMFNAKITGYVFLDSYYARSLVVYSVSLYRIRIRYYISCSVSWSGLWPDLPVSARRTRTGAGTRELMQGMIQNKTCNNVFITYMYIQQKAVTYMHMRTFIYIE